MVAEARRTQLHGVWLFIVVGIFIGISFATLLFLTLRETRVGRKPVDPAADAFLEAGALVGLAVLGRLSPADWL